MSLVRQYRNPFAIKDTPKWLADARKRSGNPPYPHLDFTQPCKNGQPYVAPDGSCLRCGADQGVAGPQVACHPEREVAAENQSLDREGDYGRAANEASLDEVRELLEGRP